MTKNREDYLKTIFQFEENDIVVTNKLLADSLKVAPASVSQMITKLSEQGLIKNINNQISLTKNAIVIAKDLVSKHRLWEAFLLEFLGYNWDEVHEEAEVLEHVTSKELMEKLNEFLNYPTNCPHGGRIYLNENNNADKLLSLKDLSINERAIIKRFKDDQDLLDFVKSINLKIDDEISLESIDNFNKIYNFKLADNLISLHQETLDKIFVTII